MFANRARGRPVGFLARKAADLTARYARAASASVGLNPYKARANSVGRIRPHLLTDSASIIQALEMVKRSCPEDIRHVIEISNRARHGEVTVLSSTARGAASEAWDTDFVSGARWPTRFHTTYLYSELLDLGRPSDIKIPWELARLQVLPSLALAYRLTGDPGYVDAAVKRFESWDRACPVGFGITWTVGMEASFRAISLLLTADLLAGSDGEGAFVTPRLRKSLGEHGRFLSRNVEYSDVNGNHYTSCLLGLLYLGVALPDQPDSRRWRDTAVRALVHEIIAESYGDGVCHEGSIPYHRLVTEIFVHAALLARRNQIDLGDAFHERLPHMLGFTAGYLKPSGHAPVWGDADDGRVHGVGGQAINDHRYLLQLGAALYGRSELASHAGPLRLDAAVLMDASLQAAAGNPAGTPAVASSEAFAEGGFFILRAGKGFALFDCGDVGLRGRGGHGHHDTLALELSLDGLDVLVDSGCSSYTRDRHDRWGSISVHGHNVASLDGREPAKFADARLTHAGAYSFQLRAWQPEGLRVVGAHDGYGPDASYVREVSIDPSGDACTVIESFTAPGEHRVTSMFHFAENWSKPEIERGRAILDRDDASLEVLWDHAAESVAAERTAVYPSYGSRRERWALRCDARFVDSTRIRFSIKLNRKGRTNG